MKSLISLIVLGLVLGSSSLPAFAQRFSIIRPNSQGGYSGASGINASGSNGGAVKGGTVFRSDGQGTIEYGTGHAVTTPSGSTYSGNSSGTYNRSTGLSSSGTHTVNGTTYNSSTSSGTVTVTDGNGNNQSYTRPFLRR